MGSVRTASRVPVVVNGVRPSVKLLGRLLLMSSVCISTSPEEVSASVSSWGSGLDEATSRVKLAVVVNGSCIMPPDTVEMVR
jgi:hypothetical protein